MSSPAPTPPTAPPDRGAWRWVPSLYFAEGVPLVVVMTVAVIMYKRLGVSNSDIALFTSWLYLPWVVKPLWSMVVEGVGTRRRWVVVMQWLLAAGLAATALALNLGDYFRYTLATLTFLAVSSATHDIAADGFYLLGLNTHQQAWFVGIRSTAYRFAMIAGQGLLVMLAGWLETSSGLPRTELTIAAADQPAAELSTDWDESPAASAPANDENLVAVSLSAPAISLQGRSADEAKQFVEQVQRYNIAQGFYNPPEEAEPVAEGEKPGWVARLEEFIRTTFGPEQAPLAEQSDRVGDLLAVVMRYPRAIPAGARQVVQFDLAGGDKSFSIVEGGRYVVTAENWQQPMVAVVQADAKLDATSDAQFEIRSGNVRAAWVTVFYLMAAAYLLLAIYHGFALPRPAEDQSHGVAIASTSGWIEPLVSFFRKPGIVAILAYLLFYRFAEAQLVKLASPFLLDSRDTGGLGLTTGEVGFVYGTVGVAMLTIGGIVGGLVAAKHGLKRWLWWMVLAINLPNLAYLVLSTFQPEAFWVVNLAVGIEQFGYGFGFTAYMLYCMYVAQGEHKTVHYALCTGLMALGMMLPGMVSGWLQELIGYQRFFMWIMIATLPSFIATYFIPLDESFGRENAPHAS
ncbi:MAG: MFS transporter [Planctomycetaceae bacterium]|nr:MFS transporter [Planctomycetaceae bacterium]